MLYTHIDIHSFLTLGGITFFTALTPGPDIMYISANALSGEWGKGVAAWWGCLLGGILYLLATACGLGVLFVHFPVLIDIIKWMGVAYLLYLSWQFFSAANKTRLPILFYKNGGNSRWHIFGKGFALAILNPKRVLFFSAILPQFIHSEAGSLPLQFLSLGLFSMCVGHVVYAVYTSAFVLVGRRMKQNVSLTCNATPLRVLYAFLGCLFLSFSLALCFWGT